MSQRAIMDLLKRQGPASAALLARSLKVSAMAVRQHLYALRDQRLVSFEEKSEGVGRPLKYWRLAPAAERFFPDAHAELAVSLINGIRASFGSDGLEKIMVGRATHQIAAYREKLGRLHGLGAKVRALAQLRTAEGYMAEASPDGGGGWILLENHCPVCSAANSCVGLCKAELEVFRAVLGPDVHVERTEHLLTGSRRCAYRVGQGST